MSAPIVVGPAPGAGWGVRLAARLRGWLSRRALLRLAGVLGRNDPIPVAMSLTRQYNPELWKTLESLGVGKLAVQGARERELANIYRGNDAARKLDDEDFAEVLSFTRRAFEMAVGFRGAAGNRRPR